MHLVA